MSNDQTTNHEADPRWFALVNDTVVYTPRRKVSVSLIRELSEIPDDKKLYRDYTSPRDVKFRSNEEVDLAEGNVFYSGESSSRKNSENSRGVAKLAVAIDDRFEQIQIAEFSSDTLRDLFSLDDDAVMFRDYESPNDQPIEDDQLLNFVEGPAFYTKKLPLEIRIIVNGREKIVGKRTLSYEEVVALAVSDPRYEKTAYTVTYDMGPRKNPEGSLVKGQSVKIKNGMVFNVTATDKS